MQQPAQHMMGPSAAMPHASTAPAAPHMGPGPSHTEQTAHASREDLGPEMLMSLSQAAQQESALPQQGGRLDGHMHGQMAAHEQHHMMQQRPMEQVYDRMPHDAPMGSTMPHDGRTYGGGMYNELHPLQDPRTASEGMHVNWCHQCKVKKHVAQCTNMHPKCMKRYCENCLRNHYGENIGEVMQLENWVCPCCRSLCVCAACKRKTAALVTSSIAAAHAMHMNTMNPVTGPPGMPGMPGPPPQMQPPAPATGPVAGHAAGPVAGPAPPGPGQPPGPINGPLMGPANGQGGATSSAPGGPEAHPEGGYGVPAASMAQQGTSVVTGPPPGTYMHLAPHGQPPMAGPGDGGAVPGGAGMDHSMLDFRPPPPPPPPPREPTARMPYKCSKCGLPKQGHVCLGAPPMMPNAQMAAQRHPQPMLLPQPSSWQPTRSELLNLPVDTLKSALAARNIPFSPGMHKEELARRLMEAWPSSAGPGLDGDAPPVDPSAQPPPQMMPMHMQPIPPPQPSMQQGPPPGPYLPVAPPAPACAGAPMAATAAGFPPPPANGPGVTSETRCDGGSHVQATAAAAYAPDEGEPSQLSAAQRDAPAEGGDEEPNVAKRARTDEPQQPASAGQ